MTPPLYTFQFQCTDAYQWYIPSSLFVGYTGMAYIAVARIAYESDVEDDATFTAYTIKENSSFSGLCDECVGSFADGTIPLGIDGQPQDISLVTEWNGLCITRNFSTGYIFRAVSKGCYYLNDTDNTNVWSSDGLTVRIVRL